MGGVLCGSLRLCLVEPGGAGFVVDWTGGGRAFCFLSHVATLLAISYEAPKAVRYIHFDGDVKPESEVSRRSHAKLLSDVRVLQGSSLALRDFNTVVKI